MAEESQEIRDRLATVSGSARRLLDYVAVSAGGARYAVLRHIVRAPEPDMIEDLREVVGAGLIAAQPGQPDVYDFVDASTRDIILADVGEERLPKLRARAEAARRRVLGERELKP